MSTPASDVKGRCGWAAGTDLMREYHDHEWGFPVVEDRRLFEKICLEGFQSGLSWRTILAKRENFRSAFANFEIQAVAGFTGADVDRLLTDPGIVRHRAKIEATVNNAQRAVELIAAEGSLAAYVWTFEPTAVSAWSQDRATSTESIALARDLRRRGWRFVGPTTAYAFMQAMGLVNDHEPRCFVRANALAARASLPMPYRR